MTRGWAVAAGWGEEVNLVLFLQEDGKALACERRSLLGTSRVVWGVLVPRDRQELRPRCVRAGAAQHFQKFTYLEPTKKNPLLTGGNGLVPRTAVPALAGPALAPARVCPPWQCPPQDAMAESPGGRGCPRGEERFVCGFVPLEFMEAVRGPANEVLKMDCGWVVLRRACRIVNYPGKLECNEYFIKQKPAVNYSLSIYQGQLR